MDTKYKLWIDDDLSKSPSQCEKDGIPYLKSFASMKNRRDTMEDKAFVSTLSPDVCFCGVLDGHGGSRAAEYFIRIIPERLGEALSRISRDISKEIPTQEQVRETVEEVFLAADEQWYDQFLDADDQWREQDLNTSGTTFTGVLIFSGEKKAIYIINLGDSRTVLCLDGKTLASRDHKPSNPSEYTRIIDAGGHVSWDRVDGIIAVSRALGDIDFKGREQYKGREAKVSPIPDVTRYSFSKDIKIVMASDGFFDSILNNNGMILKYLREEEDPCGELMEYASWKSADNIIIMMLDLNMGKS